MSLSKYHDVLSGHRANGNGVVATVLLVGASVNEGAAVGDVVGTRVGAAEGVEVGTADGCTVGMADGAAVAGQNSHT